ncbi:MAG: hypothetical protein AABY86_00170, partial [Bdellovibrionota bacterium]
VAPPTRGQIWPKLRAVKGICAVTCFIVLFSLIQVTLAAPPVGKVIYLKGKATFAGQGINVNQELASNGVVATGPSSILKIYISTWQSTIVLGSYSTMELNLENANRPGDAPVIYTLEKGLCRWISDPGSKGSSRKGIHTKIAAIGVRGTDFILKENPLLSETETVVFEGEVVMVSKLDNPSESQIKIGQWGGLGGRFGQNVIRVIDLPPVVLDEFHKLLPHGKP